VSAQVKECETREDFQIPLCASNNQQAVKQCCMTCVTSAADLEQGISEQGQSLTWLLVKSQDTGTLQILATAASVS